MKSRATAFTIAAGALFCTLSPAGATVPPNPRDVAAREAFLEFAPFLGRARDQLGAWSRDARHFQEQRLGDLSGGLIPER